MLSFLLSPKAFPLDSLMLHFLPFSNNDFVEQVAQFKDFVFVYIAQAGNKEPADK